MLYFVGLIKEKFGPKFDSEQPFIKILSIWYSYK